MNTDYIIRKLKEQRSKVDQNDTEVWLKTTYSFLEEYFKSYSPRANSFRSLITDFTTNKIFGFRPGQITYIKNQALQYLDENIQYLEEQLQKEKNALLKKKQMENNEEAKKETLIAPQKLQPEVIVKTKTQLPFNMAPAFFWTVFAGLIAAAYVVGLDIGNSKFDREKSDYYEELKILKKDTSNLNRTILLKETIISQKDSIIKTKIDSLSRMDKTLTGLALLLRSQESK